MNVLARHIESPKILKTLNCVAPTFSCSPITGEKLFDPYIYNTSFHCGEAA